MQYGNVKNYFFCIFLWKNLEIQGFIIIFAIAFQNKEQGTKNKDLTALAIIINKPKISLTESCTDWKYIGTVTATNCAVIVRLLCGNSAVREGRER